jgi:sortase A
VARKHVTEKVETEVAEERTEKMKRQVPRFIRYGALVLPIFFISIGLFLVGNAVLPILNYYVSTLPGLRASSLTSPLPDEQMLDVTPIVIAEAKTTQSLISTDPVIIDTALDYTNLSNWFAGGLGAEFATQAEDTYTIDIPAVKISNAKVLVGGTDLNTSLIQFPGTALPGDKGAPVIFGHSVLRQFYNPSEKNSRRYTSIFSTIMTLKNGDEIFVTHKGVKYRYLVQEKTVVDPEDTYILNQKYDASLLKLVTCVPEGTYQKRGIVLAQLVSQ